MKLSEENKMSLLVSTHQLIEENASNTADVFFSFLNMIDGTGDPTIEFGNWSEVMLVDFKEENEIDSMLHDDFYGTYWDWKEKRANPGWKLDLLDE